MARFAYYFSCQNPDCRKSTELPLAIREEIPLRQNSLSTGIASQALLCLRCKHVFAYTREEVYPDLAPNQDPYSAPNAVSYRRIELECDKEGCESPVQLIAPWLDGLQAEERWPSEYEVAGWKLPDDLKCPNGHKLKQPVKLRKEENKEGV